MVTEQLCSRMGRISFSKDTLGVVRSTHESNGATASASAAFTGHTPPSIPPVSQEPPPLELPLPPPEPLPLPPALPLEHAPSAARGAATTIQAEIPSR